MTSMHRKQNNIILVVIFAVCVLFLILVSLSIKLIGVVGRSSYGSDGRFTILLIDNTGEALYLSVNEPEKTGSKLIISQVSDFTDVPIGIDGLVRTSTDVDSSKSLPSLISEILLKRNEERLGVTFFDMLRMYIVSRTLSGDDIAVLEESSPDNLLIAELSDMFVDREFIDEDKTIAIENGTDRSGVATRLENILLVTGGNVISVETAVVDQSLSKILYTDEESYTLKKIQELLGYPVEETTESQVADISIIIGKDGFGNFVFPN